MGMRETLSLLREPAGQHEPVSLTLAKTIDVKFAGERGGEGPVSKGQASILKWVGNPVLYNRMIQWTFELPAGTTLDDIAESLSVLMARHEALRTTYPPAEPGSERIQRIARTGELPVRIYETGPFPPRIPLIAEALTTRLRTPELDLVGGLPLRVGVAVSGGVPVTAVAVYSHAATDLAGMAVIGRQFAHLAADPASRVAGPRGHQPLDQAEAERSPEGQRRAEAALRIWQGQLRRMPQCLYAVPETGDGEGSGALTGWLWSPSAALALPHIAQRTGGTRPNVVLAALCALLARRAGYDELMLTATSANRYERRLAGYVGTMTGDSIISVATSAATFDELVRRTGAAMFVAGRGAMYNGATLTPVISATEHERGIGFARDCVFNDLTSADSVEPTPAAGDPSQAAQALSRSELQWAPVSAFGNTLLVFLLMYVEGEMMLGVQTGDTSRVPRTDLESLLRGVELLLAQAAPGDVSLARLGEITGVEPVPRGPGWLLAGSCWVELAEVQRLLDDALPALAARVFAVPGPAGDQHLVAYLAARDSAITPAQAHAACMAHLPSNRTGRGPGDPRLTAMAPARYVICREPPADPASLAAWQHHPPITEGTGR